MTPLGENKGQEGLTWPYLSRQTIEGSRQCWTLETTKLPMFLWGFLFGFFVFLLLFLFSTKLSPKQLEFPHYQLLRHYKLFDLVILWYKKRNRKRKCKCIPIQRLNPIYKGVSFKGPVSRLNLHLLFVIFPFQQLEYFLNKILWTKNFRCH